MSELRQLHLRGATSASRVVMEGDREWLVIPTVALMEGVIHPVNAQSPEFVSASVLEKAAASWNGKPVTLGHPVRNGTQCSANSEEIKATHHIGEVRNARYENKKLLCESWIDAARAEKLHPKLLASLRADERSEVSVGAFVETDNVASSFNGKPYKAAWLETKGDHLAMLYGGRGACSVAMGCGTHRAAMHLVTAEGLEVLGDSPGHEFHGNQYTGGASLRNVGEGRVTGSSHADRHADAHALVISVDKGTRGIQHEYVKKGGDWHHAGSTPTRLVDNGDSEYTEYDGPRSKGSGKVEPALHAKLEKAARKANGAFYSPLRSLGDTPMAEKRSLKERILALFDTPEGADVEAVLEDFRTAVGKRNNATDQQMIQTMHDHATQLGATCDYANARFMAQKDCDTCHGTGQVKEDGKQSDCPACDGEGVYKAAEDGGSSVKEDSMKSELIATLTACPCSGFTTADVKTLEAFSDERLTALIEVGKARKKVDDDLKAAQDKTIETDTALRAAQAKTIETDAALRAAQAAQIPADELTELRTLAADKKAADATEHATLVGQIKAAQTAFTEEDLKAKPLPELRKLAVMAKVEAPKDFSGRGMPVPRAAAAQDFTPPNPYDAALKALKAN